MDRRAFTLIEVLIATSVGVMMLALTVAALVGIRKVVDRNMALTVLHENASIINKELLRDVGSSFPGAKWELRADPGAGGWGTGDEKLTLTWMTTISDPRLTNYELMPGPRHDLTWCRLQWVGGGSGQVPRLYYLQNTPFRRVASGSTRIQQDPLLRRDRRRDLDDNDLRYIPGADLGVFTAIAMPGDSADLDTLLLQRPIHAPMIQATDVRISWKDRDGWTMVATAASGVKQYDPSGSEVTMSGGTWDNQQCVAVDGVYLDARPETPPGWPRTIAASRPLLVRLSCTLAESGAKMGAAERPALRLDLSFPTGAELPIP